MKLDRAAFLDVVRHTPLVSVDLVVRDGAGRVLLGLRNNAPAKDCWFVPGGRICKDERIDAAIARVALEELGLAVSPGGASFLGVYEHLYPENVAGEPGFGTHYVVLAHELRVAADELRLDPEQHRDYRWFTPDEVLRATDVHANTKVYFED